MGRMQFPPTRRGYDLREVVSALQKAIRRSDVDAALYWAFEMEMSNFHGWVWKRLRIICSEDIGPAAPGLAADVRALYENYVEARKAANPPSDDRLVFLAHAVIALATAPKCRASDWAVLRHRSDFVRRREIPDEAYDKHTLRGRQQGRGWTHFFEEATKLVDGDGREDVEKLEGAYREWVVENLSDNAHPEPVNPWAVSKAGDSQTSMEAAIDAAVARKKQ